MKLLAIQLGCQRTTVKSLVIIPLAPARGIPKAGNPLPAEAGAELTPPVGSPLLRSDPSAVRGRTEAAPPLTRGGWEGFVVNRQSELSLFHTRLFQICLAVLLSGCALLPSKPIPAARPAQSASKPFALNGRISIDHQGKRHTAGLRWTHQAQSDEILLLAPLGQTAARIYSDTRRDAQKATLDDGDGHHQADDAETLMEQVLGWHLPLSGLHLWVLGLPDNDGAAQIERDDNGRISVLHQSGWEVRYLRYADTSPDSLPSRLQLNHEDLQMQLLIDEWEWNP
ncbi:MAG: lipoprotein insertase outer membrane protein LolB [Gallionella sp.]